MKKWYQKSWATTLGLMIVVGGIFTFAAVNNDRAPAHTSRIQRQAEARAQKDSMERAEVVKWRSIYTSIDSLALANNLQSGKDEFRPHLTFYYPRSKAKHRAANAFFPYLVKNDEDSTLSLRLVIQYTDDDWLFISNVKALISTDTTVVVDIASGDFERDNGSGIIWEWADISFDSGGVYLALMAVSDEVKIRLNGSNYRSDRTLTPKEIQGIEDIIQVWGKLPQKPDNWRRW